MVLWVVLVEISVVDTHSPFIVLFLYKNRILYPLWMDYFFNESSCEKLSDLPFNGLTLIVGKPSQALLFRRSLRVYIQSMLDQLPGTPGISAGFHANMSWLARRKLTSASSYLSPKPAPMTAVLDESPS
jgi:hypothetical protein